MDDFKRNFDLVFCLDGTGSMGPILESLADYFESFIGKILKIAQDHDYNISSIRAKAIVFRDYMYDKYPMDITEFVKVSDRNGMLKFVQVLSSIEAQGGGDIPENGLEALYYAMHSDFESGEYDQQYIIMFTDADALPLLERKDSIDYPKNMPDMEEFIEFWRNPESAKLSNEKKHMILCAPVGTIYEDMSMIFDRTEFLATERQNGLMEFNLQNLIESIFKPLDI